MAAPTWQANGGYTAANTSTGAITVPWPTHAIDDIGVCVVETSTGEAAVETSGGWTAFPSSPQESTTIGTRLSLFWKRATTTSMASATFADAGNHITGWMTTIRGCVASGDPFTVSSGGSKDTASTAMSVPGLTTFLADQLMFVACARDNDAAGGAFSSPANASWATITERQDVGEVTGNGGGFASWTGVLTAAGVSGTTTATINASAENAFQTIAFTSVAPELPSLVMPPLVAA